MKNEIYKQLKLMHASIEGLKAFVGFDGVVDKIVSVVDKRSGTGKRFTPITTISAWGERIGEAAGKSTNMELYLNYEKFGGNAPIMAHALGMGGIGTTLAALVGEGKKTHPAFLPLKDHVKMLPLGEPGTTHAVEFGDGKVMLGYLSALDCLSFDHLNKVLGSKKLLAFFDRSDLIAINNWTMTPQMTPMLRKLAKLPIREKKGGGKRTFFFDLCDPQKRSIKDLQVLLKLLKSFEKLPSSQVALGLNYKESQQVAEALGIADQKPTEAGLKKLAGEIRQALKISFVAIHPTDSAACASAEGAYWVKGPYVAKPKISTGAGDHFNAGLAAALAAGCTPEAALTLGVTFSGYYVRNAKSPTLAQALSFIKKGW